MITISRTTGTGTCYKIKWKDPRTSSTVQEEGLLNAIAHYYALPQHDLPTCPLCKEIHEKLQKKNGKRKAR